MHKRIYENHMHLRVSQGYTLTGSAYAFCNMCLIREQYRFYSFKSLVTGLVLVVSTEQMFYYIYHVYSQPN